MSHYYSIACTDCNEETRDVRNHGSEAIRDFMKLYPSIHDAITKLREVGIGEFDQSLADYGCPSDTIPFLAKHYGHRLVLRSEYWHSGKDEYADELLSDRSDAIA